MRRATLLTTLLSLLAIPALASAAGLQPFDAQRFEQLQAAGKPIVVAVHASWCPTCKAQRPIQAALMQGPAFRGYTLFTVDFDTDQAVLERFHVIKQSTMIVFKGRIEVGRSIGDTQRGSIEALMLKARG